MALVVPNQAEVIALKALLNNTAPQDLVLRLYVNNVTPAETDTEANYTEASGFGYAAVNLTAASWSFSSGAPSSASYPAVTFSFTGALGNVYGYYLTQSSSGKLVWSERFSNGPYAIAALGDSIQITPFITCD